MKYVLVQHKCPACGGRGKTDGGARCGVCEGKGYVYEAEPQQEQGK